MRGGPVLPARMEGGRLFLCRLGSVPLVAFDIFGGLEIIVTQQVTRPGEERRPTKFQRPEENG